MTIGVEDQYIYIFSIKQGDVTKNDFIQEDDLHTFSLIEEAGNSLPTFKLIFDTQDASVLPYLNEGNDIQITFGVSSRSDKITSSFSILRMNYSRKGESKYAVYIIGIYSALKYLSEDAIKQYTNMSGIEAIKEVVSASFRTDFNVSKSKEIMTWLRPNISAKTFVNETWMHSYINGSFIGIGIDSSGTFILKDMKLESSNYAEKARFNFTVNKKENTDILYDGDYAVGSNTGFLNQWMGYGREKHVFGMETGVDEDILEDSSILLTNASSFVRTSDILKKKAEAGFSNDNVHENFWKAYYTNLQSLALFSAHKITLSFHNNYQPIKILDVVTFSDTELNRQEAAAGTSAGRYFVCKVVRNISNRQSVTIVQMCRESISDVKGNLR